MFRSVVVGAALSVFVACGPQVPVPDAGSAGGGAGGGVAVGGGRAGGQGGGSGGGTAMDAGQGDGGCPPFAPITPGGVVPGLFTVGTGNQAGLQWWSTTIGAVGQSGRVSLFQSELYQQDGAPVVFPFEVPSLRPDLNFQNCQVCFQAALGCDMNGNNCSGLYLATSGAFSFDAGVANPDAGTFVAVGTNVTYREWDFSADRPASATCFVVPTISFTATWSFPGPSTDGGATTDAGAIDPDGGLVMDAGVVDPDGGSTSDAGTTPDAGQTPDAGTPDGGDGGR